jgi:hypothetical protein
MDGFDLIGLVRPAGGWYALFAVKNKRQIRQQFFETREELDSAIAKLTADRWCTFFGLAKFKTGENRTQDNAESLQSFWVDIDCGPGKSQPDDKTGRPSGYETQAEGINALAAFCRKTNLPRPLLVNSGNGIHAYWPLNEELPVDEWDVVAKKFRAACVHYNFYVDTKVFESARVLRPLGTFNFKGDAQGEQERPVVLLSKAGPFDLATIRDALGIPEAQTTGLFGQPRRERKLTALGAALAANVDSNFTKIMQRTKKGDGCQQLGDCYANRATLAEPRWFDALSIAKFCNDRDTAIHKMSEGHPDYDYDVVERKTRGIKGPHTCAEFDINNPGGCDGCPHQGKIKSPITLGKIIARSNGVVTVEEPAVNDDNGDENSLPVTHIIPEFPFPYFRGKNGGIYIPQEGDDAEPLLVYENDLYVVKRMNDPLQGDVVVLRLHLPKDGMKEFVISNVQLVEKRELCKALASYGVVCPDKKFVYLASYLQASVKAFQERERVEKMRSQFGWVDNDSKFILGDREITAGGTYFSPPSTATKDLAAHIHTKGDFEKWKEVFNLYGKPGMEAHAFAALTAFGAPLLRFLGQKGALINLINNKSGTGKSTVLYMCNSVYGAPVELAATWQDTLAAKIHKLGVMNNLPYTIDEMTNMQAADFSTLAYSISQGRGRDRMKQSANEMRSNQTSWATIALCSSNASFTERLTGSKSNPEGELMRLLEYPIDNNGIIPADEAKHMFDHQLRENYGHAGEIYLKWLVTNKEDAVSSALEIQAKVDREGKLTQRERFWSATIATNMTGGLIAKKLGLIDWDLMRIYLWATGTMLPTVRDACAAPVSEVSAIVGDYINRHIQNVLIVAGEIDRRTSKFSAPLVEPKGPLLIRYEPDTKKMFLMAKAFKDDCVKVQINYKDTVSQLKMKGILVDSGVKRLAKGMRLESPGVHSLVLDCSHADFSSVDAFLPDPEPVATSAGGEG